MTHPTQETVSPEKIPAPVKTTLGYGPPSAVLVGVSSFFVAQFGAVLLIAFPLMLAGWDGDRMTAWLESSNIAIFSVSLLASTLMISLIAVFLHRRKTAFTTIGLKRPHISDAGYALLGLVVYFVATITVIGLAKWLVPALNLEQQQELGYSKDVAGVALGVAFLGLVILPPLAEEIMFRGFLYTGLRSRLPVIVSMLLTSVLFGVVHLQWGSDQPLLWVAAIDTFVLSLVLVYLRESRHSLWPAIFLHMFKNGYAFLLLFVFKVV